MNCLNIKIFPYTKKYSYKNVNVVTDYSHIKDKLDAIVNSPKFKNWVDNITAEDINLKEFNVTDVDFFGKICPEKVGFIKGKCTAYDTKTASKIMSNIVFCRGNSVAVLIIVNIKETSKKYVLLCKQIRLPVGKVLIEACAGMLDDKVENGEVLGVVFKEIKEETGFEIKKNDLIKLGKPIIPSGGGCDENIQLYAWETSITENEFDEKQLKVFGCKEENESIQLCFYEYDNFDNILDELGDVKAECCWRRYKNLSK